MSSYFRRLRHDRTFGANVVRRLRNIKAEVTHFLPNTQYIPIWEAYKMFLCLSLFKSATLELNSSPCFFLPLRFIIFPFSSLRQFSDISYPDRLFTSWLLRRSDPPKSYTQWYWNSYKYHLSYCPRILSGSSTMDWYTKHATCIHCDKNMSVSITI
jgi:hypothetical protein